MFLLDEVFRIVLVGLLQHDDLFEVVQQSTGHFGLVCFKNGSDLFLDVLK